MSLVYLVAVQPKPAVCVIVQSAGLLGCVSDALRTHLAETVIKAIGLRGIQVASPLLQIFKSVGNFGKQGLPVGIHGSLSISNSQSGKIHIARQLGLLDDNERKFLISIGEIRNAFAHDVRNTALDLPAYVNGLEAGKKKSLLKSISFSHTINWSDPAVSDAAERELKFIVWDTGLYMLGVMSMLCETELSKQAVEATKLAHYDSLLAVNERLLTLIGNLADPQAGGSADTVDTLLKSEEPEIAEFSQPPTTPMISGRFESN